MQHRTGWCTDDGWLCCTFWVSATLVLSISDWLPAVPGSLNVVQCTKCSHTNTSLKAWIIALGRKSGRWRWLDVMSVWIRRRQVALLTLAHITTNWDGRLVVVQTVRSFGIYCQEKCCNRIALAVNNTQSFFATSWNKHGSKKVSKRSHNATLFSFKRNLCKLMVHHWSWLARLAFVKCQTWEKQGTN